MAETPAESLRRILETRGVSQEEFAKMLGVQRQSVSKILTDRMDISPAMALRIGRATETPPEAWLPDSLRGELTKARRKFKHQIYDKVETIPSIRLEKAKIISGIR